MARNEKLKQKPFDSFPTLIDKNDIWTSFFFFIVAYSAPGERTFDAGFDNTCKDGSKLHRTTTNHDDNFSAESSFNSEKTTRKLCSTAIADFFLSGKFADLIEKLHNMLQWLEKKEEEESEESENKYW